MTLINLSVSPTVSRSHAALTGQHLGADHPFTALSIVIGGVAAFVLLLQRCMKRDSREGREGKEGPRLD